MTEVQLGDVATIVQGGRHRLSGKHFVEADKGFPAYGAGGMNGHLETYEFERDALVLSSIGARCGKVFFASGRWSSLANTQVICPDESRADALFLWYQLNDEARWPRQGAGQPFIRPSDVKSHRIFFPPLTEQRRIAAILDKADAIRARRRAALADADALARATFLHLFGDPVINPMEWETESLSELIADGPQNGLYRPASDYGTGTPILRIDSFQRGRTSDLTQLKRLRIDAATRARWTLNADDIVINRVNSPEHLGKSALIPQLTEPTVFESNMMRFSVDITRADPRFLIDQLQTAYIRRQIARRAKPAVNQSSINQEDVRSFEVRLPPLPRQQAYARFVTELEASRTRHCMGLANADELYASLAARAFRGEL